MNRLDHDDFLTRLLAGRMSRHPRAQDPVIVAWPRGGWHGALCGEGQMVLEPNEAARLQGVFEGMDIDGEI